MRERHEHHHGHHGHRGHQGRAGSERSGFDPRHVGRGRFPNREELLAKLERYQRDLEERTADVADTIRRLKAEEAPAPAGADPDAAV